MWIQRSQRHLISKCFFYRDFIRDEFGIRWDSLNDEVYRSLILDACLAVPREYRTDGYPSPIKQQWTTTSSVAFWRPERVSDGLEPIISPGFSSWAGKISIIYLCVPS